MYKRSFNPQSFFTLNPPHKVVTSLFPFYKWVCHVDKVTWLPLIKWLRWNTERNGGNNSNSDSS